MLLASGAQASDITIKWKVTGDPLDSGYLPKVASDGIKSVVTIAENGTGLSALEDELGSYQTLPKPKVNWTGATDLLYGPLMQVGYTSSIALAYDSKDYYDTAIEMHQGSVDDESTLRFQLGTIDLESSTFAINWRDAARLGPGHVYPLLFCYPLSSCPVPEYDNGYNPTVAADVDGPSHTSATVVEVHQSGKTASVLYYHVGILTLGPKPSISWGASLSVGPSPIDPTVGSAPTVSVANNVAVLVAQGSGGTLWYSIGIVDTASSTIAWTTPVSYGGTGYNPTVSVYGAGSDLWISGRVLVEAHQLDNTAGPLVYSVGVLDGSSPTSISWSTTSSGTADTNIIYATGCYPSVALAFGDTSPELPSNVTVTETHQTACGSASSTQYWYGFLDGK
jgi:hypothetical protein